MNKNLLATSASGLTGAVLLGATAQASPFVYNSTDLLLGFRNGNGNDFVVDLGPVTSWYAYSALQPGTSYNITAYSGSQLTSVWSPAPAAATAITWVISHSAPMAT